MGARKMKRILAVVLAVVMVFALVACNDASKNSGEVSSQPTPSKPAIFGDSDEITVTEGDFEFRLKYNNGSISVALLDYYGGSRIVSIPSNAKGYAVTEIRARAFKDCNFITSVTIPDSVTRIGVEAFSGCRSLTSVTIPDSVTDIGEYAFSDCSSLTSVTIPDSVTSIEAWTFSNCQNLSITIPDSVTSIGDAAFFNCRSLTSVTIPDSVTNIGKYAFCGCSSLTSVTIPDSVTEIGERAFDSNLRIVFFYSEKQLNSFKDQFPSSADLIVIQ